MGQPVCVVLGVFGARFWPRTACAAKGMLPQPCQQDPCRLQRQSVHVCFQLRRSKCSAHYKPASCLDHAYQASTPTSGEDSPCRHCLPNTNVEERCSACSGPAADQEPFFALSYKAVTPMKSSSEIVPGRGSTGWQLALPRPCQVELATLYKPCLAMLSKRSFAAVEPVRTRAATAGKSTSHFFPVEKQAQTH